MSQQETIIGKLKLLEKVNGETLEDQCKRVYCEKYETRENPMWDSWQEDIVYETDDKLVICNGNIYEVIQRKDMDDMSIFEITKVDDGTYDFTLSYYNGGCGFSEAIERAFARMKEDGENNG